MGKHEDSVWSVAWTPKGQLLSGSVDETLRVWDVTPAGLAQRHALGGHRLGVVAVAASGTEPRELRRCVCARALALPRGLAPIIRGKRKSIIGLIY